MKNVCQVFGSGPKSKWYEPIMHKCSLMCRVYATPCAWQSHVVSSFSRQQASVAGLFS